MTDTSTLRIDTTLDDATQATIYLLSGEIDVTAAAAFAPLHGSTPPGGQAALDFADVTRVNSMGLAQLMRLLEQWRGQGVAMEARNMTRTISMLFKMTGMNRYFSGGAGTAGAETNGSAAGLMRPLAGTPRPSAQAAAAPAATTTPRGLPAARSAQPPQLRRVVRNPAAAPAAPATHAASTAAPAAAASSPASHADAKLSFAVSLQSNQQLSGWYYLNTLLQRELDLPISISINQLDATSSSNLPSIVFARPFDACALITEHGYLPVVRPVDDTDEVSIVVRQDDPRQAVSELAEGTRVVTAVEQSFVLLLGRFLCDEYGLDSGRLAYQFTGNEITALKALLNGQADMLFMLRKNYEQLSHLSRSATRALHESETGMAYHMLLLKPEHRDLAPRLSQALLELDRHEKGQQALQDLGISGWATPNDDEINMLLMLYQRYMTK
jgi:anti-anti-sigma regulatory factor/ABC-type phosphate/phosphonate transport system substrate-binding protein